MDKLQLRQSILNSAKAEFSRSGGPGGQNVNKVNSKVILRMKIDDLHGLDEKEIAQLKTNLSSRVNNEGELLIRSSEERSQHINLERAYLRMEALIAASAALPAKRRPTKPGRAAREERLKTKRMKGIKKAERSYKYEDN